ncbi:MAG: recombinase RecT [Flavobacteriaceae bacterium]|jgi:recombinational DNA repair protein RecT|nr:recombinase RecT [Flavobacteriaceae bacterium]
MNKTQTLELIQNTAPQKIAELDVVKARFIKNYNAANRSEQGDLMYHRQLVFFNQQITGNSQLMNCDKFSLYAAFVTAAVNGYSFDPEDNEVYLVPYKGKAALQRQAGAHVRRLIKTQQTKFADQPKLVYKGDVFEVEGGRVTKHIERFESDEIIAGYARFIIDDKGDDRYFIYRKSDWEAWRKKSPNPKTIEKTGTSGKYLSESLWDNGIVGGTQPDPNFLRTKIIKHACKEKCWATGSLPPGVETYTGVEIDTEDLPVEDAEYTEIEPTAETPQVQVQTSFVPDSQQENFNDDYSF